jgi:NAD(P)-dependent dehydrogenase (short-subunit alcohol dehydrogenase family)
VEAHGRLDAAFNDAGEGAMRRPPADVAPADFDRVIEVNLRGTFLCRHEIAPMLESGGGSIVNMASTAGSADGVARRTRRSVAP